MAKLDAHRGQDRVTLDRLFGFAVEKRKKIQTSVAGCQDQGLDDVVCSEHPAVVQTYLRPKLNLHLSGAVMIGCGHTASQDRLAMGVEQGLEGRVL